MVIGTVYGGDGVARFHTERHKNNFEYQGISSWKINMESKNGAWEDDFPFQLGGFLGSNQSFSGVFFLLETNRTLSSGLLSRFSKNQGGIGFLVPWGFGPH